MNRAARNCILAPTDDQPLLGRVAPIEALIDGVAIATSDVIAGACTQWVNGPGHFASSES